MPVIWFAVFDWEHTKEVFLDTPKLYAIGMNDVYFNTIAFWRWFFYAVWQGILIVLCVMFTFNFAVIESGQQSGLILEGAYVFYAVVVVVNIKILISSFEFTFWMMFWIFGSIILYYLTLLLFSVVKATSLYGI